MVTLQQQFCSYRKFGFRLNMTSSIYSVFYIADHHWNCSTKQNKQFRWRRTEADDFFVIIIIISSSSISIIIIISPKTCNQFVVQWDLFLNLKYTESWPLLHFITYFLSSDFSRFLQSWQHKYTPKCYCSK